MRIPREQLYEEVWSEPMTTVAERYGRSSVALAKTCERLKIPSPPRGYWQRREAGFVDPKPPLPAPGPGDALDWVPSGGERPRMAPSALPKAPKQPAERVVRQDRPAEHPLVTEKRSQFDSATHSYDNDYLRAQWSIDVYVTRDVLPQALALASDLYLALEDFGYRVELPKKTNQLWRKEFEHCSNRPNETYSQRWRPGKPTIVTMGTLAYGITVFEPSEFVEVKHVDGKWVRLSEVPPPPPKSRRRLPPSIHEWTTTHEMGTRKLAIRAYSPYANVEFEQTWTEAEHGDLRVLFEGIVRKLERAAKGLARAAADQRVIEEQQAVEHEAAMEVWRREEIERARLAAEAARRRSLEESRGQLLGVIEQWAQAGRIADFIAGIETTLEKLPSRDQQALRLRLQLAKDLFGAPDVLQHFMTWDPPPWAVADPVREDPAAQVPAIERTQNPPT